MSNSGNNSRTTKYTDVNGKQICKGDTVRVVGSVDVGVTEIYVDELCIVKNLRMCKAINEKTIPLGYEMYYHIEWFYLSNSNDNQLSFEVVTSLDKLNEENESEK